MTATTAGQFRHIAFGLSFFPVSSATMQSRPRLPPGSGTPGASTKASRASPDMARPGGNCLIGPAILKRPIIEPDKRAVADQLGKTHIRRQDVVERDTGFRDDVLGFDQGQPARP